MNSNGGAFISVDWSSGMTNACCRMHYACLVRPCDKYHAKRRTTWLLCCMGLADAAPAPTARRARQKTTKGIKMKNATRICISTRRTTLLFLCGFRFKGNDLIAAARPSFAIYITSWWSLASSRSPAVSLQSQTLRKVWNGQLEQRWAQVSSSSEECMRMLKWVMGAGLLFCCCVLCVSRWNSHSQVRTSRQTEDEKWRESFLCVENKMRICDMISKRTICVIIFKLVGWAT